MNLTPLQRDIQQRSDKTLSFGCIIFEHDLKRHFLYTSLGRVLEPSGIHLRVERYDIIGHPMNWGRLCYLFSGTKKKRWYDHSEWVELESQMFRKPCYLQQTVLERDEKTCKLVLAFLKTLGPL